MTMSEINWDEAIETVDGKPLKCIGAYDYDGGRKIVYDPKTREYWSVALSGSVGLQMDVKSERRELRVRNVAPSAPAKAAPDHSKGVTPKGREWTATCGAGSVFIVIGSECWWLKNDGTICKQSDGSAAETAHKFTPNTKPIPASALAKIDRILDAKAAEDAKPKPFTAETWPKDATKVSCDGEVRHIVGVVGSHVLSVDDDEYEDCTVEAWHFGALAERGKHSTDGLTWHPAYQQESK
jgi:hypothetical protein